MFKEQTGSLLLISLSISVVLALDICEYQMNGVHLLHPVDCNKFVECQNGKTASILSCPLGLHFNRFKGMCDLRQRAACDIAFVNFASEETNCSACCALYGCYVNPECPDIPSTPGTDSTPDTPETPDTPATPCIPNTPSTLDTPATPSTPDTPSTPNTPATPDTPATPSTPDTPATPTTPVSPDTPSTADTPSTPNTPDTPSTPNTPDTPSTPITTRTPPGIPSICSNNLTVCNGKSDGSVVYVNGTCNQYIVCVGGCANIMSCPDNLQYNIDTKICDYPQNVDCPWQSTPPVTGPSGVACAHHGQCAGQVDGKLFASSNGNGYIVCQCECEIERPCPAGTKFNEELLSCARETIDGSGNGNATNNVICSTDTKICKNQTDGSLFPIDGVCNKFYKCNKGCAVEILCPNNLIYNPNTEYCDYSQNYKCPWPYSPPTGPSAGPSGIACPSGGRCTGQAEGTLFPSPNSCSKYVVCHCECEVEKNCSNGLYWDNDQLTCNYSANVKCDLT